MGLIDISPARCVIPNYIAVWFGPIRQRYSQYLSCRLFFFGHHSVQEGENNGRAG